MSSVMSFRLFGIPVTIGGSFILVAALLGLSGAPRIETVVAWVALVFVSILIHELGHAFTALSFGSDVAIELNGLGGLTRWNPPGELTPGRRALVAAAGSAVGLVFGGLVWLAARQLGPFSGLTGFVITNLVYVNVFWGLLNWLPIRPLDGGHLLLSLLEKVAPSRVETVAKVIFVITAGIALFLALRYELLFVALLAGWLLFSEFAAGRARPPAGPVPDLSYEDPRQESAGEPAPETRTEPDPGH
ncbi:MAG: site-2 protease family protein [Actinobacteria bacterium]|nr:site-2 protease family protein [Actinomycetota bacterium]